MSEHASEVVRRRGVRELFARLRPAGWEAPVALALVAVGLTAPILFRLSMAGAQSDIPVHAALAKSMVESGGWLSYTLWYPLVHFGAGGSTDTLLLRKVSITLLLLSVVFRVVVVYFTAWYYTRNRAASTVISGFLLVAMPLMNPFDSRDIYLGQIAPNVWHNSTQIFALPFAVLAFIAAAAWLRRPTLYRAGVFSVLALASTLAKPSYTITLLPALGIMLLVRMHREGLSFREQLRTVALGFVPVTVLLTVQYTLVFGEEGLRKTELVFAPLVVWRAFSTNIALSLVLSLAGAVGASLLTSRGHRRDPGTILAWCALALAVMEITLFAERFEDGTISLEGNLLWGSYSAVFMVFLSAIIGFARTDPAELKARWHGFGYAIVYLLLSLHAATGLYYLGRAGVDGYKVWT